MPIEIEKILSPMPALGRKSRSDLDKLRRSLATLKVTEGIRVTFESAKGRHFGSYLNAATAALAPRRFSYRTLDAGEKRIFGVWRKK